METPADSRYRPGPSIPRRHRVVQSCFSCRSRKLKCDKKRPCKTCQNAGRTCTSNIPSRPALDERQHRHTEREAVKYASYPLEIPPEPISPAPYSSALLTNHDDLVDSIYAHRSLEIEKVSFMDAVYEDTTEECLLDLGVQLGRMRLMSRIGGYHQPELIQQIGAVLHIVHKRNNIKFTEEGVSANTVYGQSTVLGPFETFLPRNNIPPSRHNSSTPSYLLPNSDYMAPSGHFFIGTNTRHFDNDRNFLNLEVCRHILNHYWGTAHILWKCLHRPSFEKQWDAFWACIARDVDPPASVEACVMAVLLSGAIATPELTLNNSFGMKKSVLLENFKAGTESALARAKVIHTAKIETVQALVIYVIAVCRTQLSKEHIALLGVTIGIAETMGLHRDPKLYGFDEKETHVRRLLWHQLCFLDLKACEAHRSRPQIRENEFDAMIPPSVNDRNLNASVNNNTWTDTSFSILNFECSVIHRVIWLARPKLEKKEFDIPTVLGWIMDFRMHMLSKYSFLSEDIPIQRYAKLVLEVSIAKLFSMVLNRYHRAINSKVPERLYHLLFDQIIIQLSNILTLETSPELHPWSLYVGAWNHYRTAMILLEEVSVYPQMPEANKIWRILDYIFLQPPGLTPDEKSIAILSAARERLTEYSRLKKMKVPGHIAQKLNPGTESQRLIDSESYNLAPVGSNGTRGAPNEPLQSMPRTISSELTEMIPFGESQYSPHDGIDIIEDIDWTRWDYVPANDFNLTTSL